MNYKILINKENKISKQALNDIKLINTKDYLNNDVLIERKTFYMFEKLQAFLKTKDIFIELDSAYRSIDEQKKLRINFQAQYGTDYVKKYVAEEGCSEHHTGMCVDIILKINEEYLDTNEKLLMHEEILKEIIPYLQDYGFILRYPKAKENITGYSYEPWHFRYVGKRTATIIYQENLTLEEYLKKYNVNGVLIVNKPAGITSRDVVDIIGKKFDTKKVGHTGTLDPLAEGVLILTIGKATRISEDIMSDDKEYLATVKMGIRTDTLDITGKVLEEQKVPENIALESLLKSFEKTYLQEVPLYSAVKVKGMKLYQYARNNQKVELPKKEITIKKITLLEENSDTFKFKCLVSKGTYIRSLIRDIGASINIPMTMQNLIRTKESKYTIEDSYTIEEIRNDKYKIIPIEEVLDYPIININFEEYTKIKNGVTLENIYNIEDKVIFKYKNEVIAIYQTKENKLVSYKNFG